ncbi:MmgE/PrpD family protein [Streptomyces mirabilis]|uniref:MmgE/PrpD family protein n=1 Tax=Streptomyces mirabilis TaxID=68239 RepID=UPI0033D7F176
MVTIAESLASWAIDFRAGPDDLALSQRSLVDTAAVALAARDHPLCTITAGLAEAARWASIGHVLDFDDLHLESTTHISVVIVPAVLASGGGARAYLAGAGVMARLGGLLGWQHYTAGWHATCTAGAPAAAVAAGVALGLSRDQLATAMALAVPAAGGVQNAFGTHSKSLQVGFAAEAGVRAARLAQAGATADPSALDEWLELVGGEGGALDLDGPAVPGGLAIKLFPCCYAMQRPIAALREIREQVEPGVARVRVHTAEASVHPLIHDRPVTGLQSKFSLPYSVATSLLDPYPGFACFTDQAVNRTAVRRLMEQVEVVLVPGGDGLLTGEVDIQVEHPGRTPLRTKLTVPPGAPDRPPTTAEFTDKLASCGPDVPTLLADATWGSVARLLRTTFPSQEAYR